MEIYCKTHNYDQQPTAKDSVHTFLCKYMYNSIIDSVLTRRMCSFTIKLYSKVYVRISTIKLLWLYFNVILLEYGKKYRYYFFKTLDKYFCVKT